MLFIHWLVSTLAILVAAYVVPGADVTIIGAFVLAVVLAVINVTLKPILFILTLPINILTLGLFSFIVNALLIMLAAVVVPGFAVANFWIALLFSIVLALINVVFMGAVKNR